MVGLNEAEQLRSTSSPFTIALLMFLVLCWRWWACNEPRVWRWTRRYSNPRVLLFIMCAVFHVLLPPRCDSLRFIGSHDPLLYSVSPGIDSAIDSTKVALVVAEYVGVYIPDLCHIYTVGGSQPSSADNSQQQMIATSVERVLRKDQHGSLW